MKKALSILLVLVMLIGMMPMQAFATEGTQETEAVEVVTEPTEAPEEETTAPTEETEPSEEEEKTEPSGEEEETESPDEEEDAEPSEPSESEEEPEVIHEHDYEAVVTDPTCTEQGYTTYTCECGDSYVGDYVDATGDHTYENGICTVCGKTVSPYLQQLPEIVIGCTNLYDVLTPVKGYYTATKYDTSNGEVLSVVIPVEPGDRIAASSFASKSENMGSVDGIRVTYLLGDQIISSLSAGDIYNSYITDGYITVPDGVDAICIPWWKPSDSNWLTLSQISKGFAIHSLKAVSEQAPTCTENGYTAGEICEVCNTSLSEREAIPATGHSYSGDTCTVCGALNLNAILGGKYVSILGDSISTFNGYSNDATVNTTIGGNGPRYDVGTADTKPGSYCLLESVNDTWWMDFSNRSGMNLLVNNSWAGSQVFGGKTSDGRVIPAAYLDRCVNLHDNTLENNPGKAPINPDVIFVYLGINDYNFNRSNVGTGAVNYADLVGTDGTYVTPTNFGEAYGILLRKMQQAYPDAQIFAMTLLPENLYSVDKSAWEQHNAYIRGAAEYYNIPVVDLAENCAITWENYSSYMIDKIHPTTAGMKLISDCIEAELIAYYKENPTHTHTYESTVTAPTCTEQGYTTYTCGCGDSYVSDYVDATGHTYKNGICTGCGEEDYDGLDLNGLNVLCLGDSITAGQGLTTETRWTNVLASKYGWNLTNKSQAGISLSSYYYTTNGKSNVSIAKKAEVLKTMTTKPDVIIVWGGHNDTSYRYSPLGTWDDETTDSFKGALNYIAELADEYAPDATLFVLTPLWTTEAPSTLKVPEGTTDTNWMFVDAIYDGAEAYGWIPINMDLCGITPFTKTGLLLDNIHPNEAGTEKIVEYLSEELASYGENSKNETIIFNKSAVSMKPGESTTLKAVLSPRSGTGTMTFTWSSSDSSVAIVDANGKITAVAPGTAVITATAPNGISADISVSVVCEHTYEPSVTAPTCTEKGYTTYTCACGDSYESDYVDALGHTYKNGSCTGCGATQPGPVITQQPESVEQEIGKKFAITVKAEGEGLTYQWYVKESGAKAFKVSSNKTAFYAYTMQSYMHNRQVYCVITDANGNSVQTETATITRPPQALKILQQPKDAQQEIGQKFSIKPEVQGDGLNYQWYYKEGYMKDFAVSSNKSSAYAYTMQSYMHNRSVYCVITDQYGNQVTTDVATITRPPVELKILNQPSDVYAVKGEKFSIKADVQGDGLTYQWYYKESYQKKFSASSNKTSAYAYSMQSYMNNRSVYCVITDKFGNQVQTEAVTIYLEK